MYWTIANKYIPKFNWNSLFTVCTMTILIPLQILINHSETIKIRRKLKTKHKRCVSNSSRGSRNWFANKPRLKKKLWCFSAVAMAAAINTPKIQTFDSDSVRIGVDNRASGCISFCKEDFDGPLRKCNKIIRSYGGNKSKPLQMGTLKWTWDDDSGKPHTFRITNSYFDPDGGVRLLSPQHWAQATGQPRNAGETTNGIECRLFWNNGKNKLTIPLNRSNNVATLTTTPGYERFEAFCAEADIGENEGEDRNPIICQQTISIVEDKIDLLHTKEIEDTPGCEICAFDTVVNNKATKPTSRSFRNIGELSTEAQMLQLHRDLQHIPFSRIQTMARLGIVNKRFAKCQIPTCAACCFGRATRRKWRNPGKHTAKDKPDMQPGDQISVDQIVSATPGFIAQTTGILTKKRYTCQRTMVHSKQKDS